MRQQKKQMKLWRIAGYLYKLPTTGLRFFTVYGPWTRPDMALFIFAKYFRRSQSKYLMRGNKQEILHMSRILLMELSKQMIKYPAKMKIGQEINRNRHQVLPLFEFII